MSNSNLHKLTRAELADIYEKLVLYYEQHQGLTSEQLSTQVKGYTDTFNALVESAALDIHAYIIQCNNRLYGDSRIRAPYKERYQRDLMRVKGGNHDYCITGEIDITALRQFQSSHRSPGKPFKPVPDGFAQDMAYSRKALPKGDS
ncbi:MULTISPECIES: hypothetical protein [Enterobacterales]|nr:MULTISPECIES: hypothetical protein [Klebsiella]WDQ05302.1 hypothetical protein PVK22_25580 [Klebsiella oxytoca]